MPSFSITGIGGIVAILIICLKFFGVEVPEGWGGKLTEAIAGLLDCILLVWGQLRRPDLIAGLVHKKKR